jgi:STE24 endopeptidase
VIDSLKSILITFLLGGLFLSGILIILEKYNFWWWRLSIASSLFLLIAIWLFPVFLLPLFNKFKPLEAGDLKETIIDFTSRNKINVNKIFVMDASTRSTHGNAFLTGIGFSRRLVLFDTILDYPKEEILSIIAHEWGHHQHYDIHRQLFTSILSFIAILYLSNLLFISGTINSAFGVVAPYSLLFYSFTLISPILFFLSPISNYLIRKQEYEADLFSLLMTKDLNSAVNSLKRLIRDNLSNLNPHPLYRIFYYTHPAPEERIQFLIKKANENNIFQ